MVGPLNPRWARAGRVKCGQRFGSWEVLCDAPFEKSGALYVLARCGCGLVREAVDWVKANLPHPTYLKLDIDRRDNDGHYEAGNLRLVTRKVNLANRRSRVATTSSTAGHAQGSPPTA